MNVDRSPQALRTTPSWLVLLLVFTLHGLLLTAYRYLDALARGRQISPLVPFLDQMTGEYASLALLPGVRWMARRFPPRGKLRWGLLWHLPAVVAFSALHTSILAVSRGLLSPWMGLGVYDYGIMPIRYAMEFAVDIASYAILLTVITLFDVQREAREREMQAAQLERLLAEARLQSLRLRMQPHFLFNALNAISTAIYEDPRAADEMLGRLADLLRRTLRLSDAPEVPLAEERQVVELYLRVMETRLEERLTTRIDIPADLERAMVPQLLLQPLVENAVRHGADPRSGAVSVEVRASRSGSGLRLDVADRGVGLRVTEEEALHRGLGLSHAAERLRGLYGDAQRITFEHPDEGGLRVSLSLPLHFATESPEPSHAA